MRMIKKVQKPQQTKRSITIIVLYGTFTYISFLSGTFLIFKIIARVSSINIALKGFKEK